VPGSSAEETWDVQGLATGLICGDSDDIVRARAGWPGDLRGLALFGIVRM
jgi:hypothetical protein